MDGDWDDEPAVAGQAYRFGGDQQQAGFGGRSFQVIEGVLQTFLKVLGAIADFLDQIVTSFQGGAAEAAAAEANNDNGGSSRWIRVLKSLGNGVRNLLPGLTLVPQDRGSLWAWSVVVLLVCFVFVGFRTSFRLFKIVEVVEVPKAASNSKRVQLPDGRTIAYREQGVVAKHSGLVIQGSTTSRLTGIPGVSDSVLQQFGIRLVMYDLPGFGQSDPHPDKDFKSSARDMASIADALGFGERFWLIVCAGGGPYAWAAIKYIPERLAGVVMLAPIGSPHTGHVTSEDTRDATTRDATAEWPLGWRLLLSIARRFPPIVQLFIDRKVLMSKITRVGKGLYATTSNKEQVLFEQKEFIAFWEKHLRETTQQEERPAGVSVAEELLALMDRGWGFGWSFGLGNLGFRFPTLRFLRLPTMKGFLPSFPKKERETEPDEGILPRPSHIWQGTEADSHTRNTAEKLAGSVLSSVLIKDQFFACKKIWLRINRMSKKLI